MIGPVAWDVENMRSVSRFGKITRTLQEGHIDDGVCLGGLSETYMTSHVVVS